MRKTIFGIILSSIILVGCSTTMSHDDFNRYSYEEGERITLAYEPIPAERYNQLEINQTSSQSALETAGGQLRVTRDALSSYDYCISTIERNMKEKYMLKDFHVISDESYVISSVSRGTPVTTYYVHGNATYNYEKVGLYCVIEQDNVSHNGFIKEVRMLDGSLGKEQHHYYPQLMVSEPGRISLALEEEPTVFIAFDYLGLYNLFEYDKKYVDSHDLLSDDYDPDYQREIPQESRYVYKGMGSLLDGLSYEDSRPEIGVPVQQ